MDYQLNNNMLRACLAIAPKKDDRDYLCSVRIEPTAGGHTLYVATDGHVLGAFCDTANEAIDAPVLLPRAAVESALKLAGKDGPVSVQVDRSDPDVKARPQLVTASGTVDAGALLGEPYPDWRAVWPTCTGPGFAVGEHYAFNPSKVHQAATALGLASGLSPARAKAAQAVLHPNESEGGAGLLYFDLAPGACVVMPFRHPVEPWPLPDPRIAPNDTTRETT